KVLLHRFAAAAGLPSPPSRFCADHSEAAAAAAKLGYPIVVKPTRSFSRAGEGLRQQAVTVVDNEAALSGALRAYAPPFRVQRSGVNGCSAVVRIPSPRPPAFATAGRRASSATSRGSCAAVTSERRRRSSCPTGASRARGSAPPTPPRCWLVFSSSP